MIKFVILSIKQVPLWIHMILVPFQIFNQNDTVFLFKLTSYSNVIHKCKFFLLMLAKAHLHAYEVVPSFPNISKGLENYYFVCLSELEVLLLLSWHGNGHWLPSLLPINNLFYKPLSLSESESCSR